MNCKKVFLALLFPFCFSVILFGKEVQTVEFLENQNLQLNSAVDYHIASSLPLRGTATIDLQSEDAWLFIDSVRPSDVIKNYLSKITISGQPIEHHKNGRIEIYQHGAVIIPHSKTYSALTVYKDADYQGEAKVYTSDSLYVPLETFDNSITSFVLKRGYMATMAVEEEGTGFSRVFIADKEDIQIPVLQPELNDKVSFIRTFSWSWPSKKGWCSASPMLKNELDITHSTWYYTWGADEKTYPDHEYVPIKQQYWWPSWEQIDNLKYVTHLLGYNEPDHAEQSDVMVDVAVEEWPKMMKSGLRLGTPATTDFNWLYQFMDKCEERNYRIDYVVIHSYWGGLSPQAWYNEMKRVHDRTKRPIWIKEWNNGANWTHEPWPEDTLAQQQKQLEELDKILYVMDTCSFIERYSIYNWVEDKRAMVKGSITQEQIDASEGADYEIPQSELGKKTATGWGNQYLTLAGVNYRDRVAPLAYNPANEVIPVYTVAAPVLSAVQNTASNSIELTWKDFNVSEFIQSYAVERKIDDGDFEEIYESDDVNVRTYTDNRSLNKTERITYRVKVKSAIKDESLYSNEAMIEYVMIKGDTDVRFGTCTFHSKSFKNLFFESPYQSTPVVVFGGQTNNNRMMRMSANGLVNSVNATYFQYKLPVWTYQKANELLMPESVPFITARAGNYKWGDLALEAGVVQNIRNEWVDVTFKVPFDEVPVVLVSQVSDNGIYPVAVRIKDVTKEGFKVHLTREKKEEKLPNGSPQPFRRQSVGYIAIAQGETTIGSRRLKVGLSDESIGETVTEISFEGTYRNPGFFCALQTSNDELTSGLRYQALTSERARITKQQETSVNAGTVSLDKVGYVILEDANSTDIDQLFSATNKSFLVYPSITSGRLNVNTPCRTKFNIHSISGVLVKSIDCDGEQIDVSDLPCGIYIISNEKGEAQQFVRVN